VTCFIDTTIPLTLAEKVAWELYTTLPLDARQGARRAFRLIYAGAEPGRAMEALMNDSAFRHVGVLGKLRQSLTDLARERGTIGDNIVTFRGARRKLPLVTDMDVIRDLIVGIINEYQDAPMVRIRAVEALELVEAEIVQRK
jgi:hypothetical protein